MAFYDFEKSASSFHVILSIGEESGKHSHSFLPGTHQLAMKFGYFRSQNSG
jgi:hypothetical protein